MDILKSQIEFSIHDLTELYPRNAELGKGRSKTRAFPPFTFLRL